MKKLLKKLGMAELASPALKRPHELSSGQHQRADLARALVVKPNVLVLDEPLSALDLKLRLAMQGELKAILRHLGTTFVHVTQDQ
ncbi:MAG: ATP-binding cassette domain-containing protein [Paracoccaceae bacterium]|nr:ATP-binding cassette domain-containing protein [Paracoccaceae bacterium]